MGHPAAEKLPGPNSRLRRRRQIVYAVGGVLLVALAGLCGFGLYLDAYGQVDRARPAQAIVILGAGVMPNHQPGDSLRTRTLHAVALYHQGLAPKIICTGGVGDYPPAEAVVAAELAKQHGVPADALLLENTSTSTTTNVRNTQRICRAHGWTRVIAVSDPYHLWRVRRNFTRAGLVVYPSPAKECARYRQWPLRVQWTAREVMAVLRDLLSGQ